MTQIPTRLAAAILTCALLAALPASASAGTAGLADLDAGGGQAVRALLFVAAPGEGNSTELHYDGATVTVSDTLAGGVLAGDGCEPVITAGSRDVRCPLAGVQLAVLALGDGDDRQATPNLDRKQRPCPLPLLVDAGDGDDVVVTCRDADTVADLGAGADRLFVGTAASVEASLGAGDDVVDTFNGATPPAAGTYDGGPGDDVLLGTPGRETFAGGDGRDRVVFPFNVVHADLDGGPGDSPEGDHVQGDVEELAAAVAGSVISGNDAPNTLLSAGAGVTVRGLGGDDTLTGSDYGEALEGGPGADRIVAGFGDDVVDPGAGADTVDGDRQAGDGFAAGNDTIRARDGEADRIACNIGADVATVDPADATDACEQVDRGGGPAGPGGTAPPGVAAVAVRVARVPLRRALRSGLRVRVTTAAATRVTLTARAGGRVVARGAVRTTAGAPATAVLRFTAAGRRSLARARRATVRIAARTADGRARTVAVALRR